jgi:hypothetical protein
MFTILASSVAMKTPIATIPKTIHLLAVSCPEMGVAFRGTELFGKMLPLLEVRKFVAIDIRIRLIAGIG